MTQPHVVQPPPSDDATNQAIATILETAVTIEAATIALTAFFKPWKIGVEAIGAALRLADRGTAHQPRPKGYHDIARATARSELYYRAAYVIRAASRIQTSLDKGLSLRQAIGLERRYWEMHHEARKSRLEAVKRDIVNAGLYGPVLGWYLNPLLNNEAECIAANGHNYLAEQGTVIGRPGAVHSGCGCTSGAPWAGAGWVDDAVRPHIVQGKPRLFKRKVA